MDAPPDGTGPSPLEALDPLAVTEVEIAPNLRHIEIYTLDGLLGLHWHGDPAAERVVLTGGGAMGGVLGPARGMFVELGRRLAEQGIGTIRIDYRRPNDLDRCTHDMIAAAELAVRRGGRRFLTVGHSFGGAIAIRAAAALGPAAAGVVTLATQSAGCEPGEELEGVVPVLAVHGSHDQILPSAASEMVCFLTGGELVVVRGGDHLLDAVADEVRERVLGWITARLGPT